MMGLQWQLCPAELLAHQSEELLHRVQLLLALTLLKSFTNQKLPILNEMLKILMVILKILKEIRKIFMEILKILMEELKY